MPVDWANQSYPESSGGGEFVGEEEFNKLVYTDAVIEITGIREEDEKSVGTKTFAAQFLVDFTNPAGEAKTKGFAKYSIRDNGERKAGDQVNARNDRLRELQEIVEAEGPQLASFIKNGKAGDIGAPKGKFLGGS